MVRQRQRPGRAISGGAEGQLGGERAQHPRERLGGSTHLQRADLREVEQQRLLLPHAEGDQSGQAASILVVRRIQEAAVELPEPVARRAERGNGRRGGLRQVQEHRLRGDPHQSHGRRVGTTRAAGPGQLPQRGLQQLRRCLAGRCPGGDLDLAGCVPGDRHPLTGSAVALELPPAPRELPGDAGQDEHSENTTAGRHRNRRVGKHGSAIDDQGGVGCRGAGVGRSGGCVLRVGRRRASLLVVSGDGRSSAAIDGDRISRLGGCRGNR